MQDSEVDWEIESAKMGDYYGNSWLTIGAGAASDEDEGSAIFGYRASYMGGAFGLRYYRLSTDLGQSSIKESATYI